MPQIAKEAIKMAFNLGGIGKQILSKDNIGLTIGIVGYSTIHSLAGRVIPQIQLGPINSTQIVEIVGGAMLARKSGYLGGIGKALIVINLASIANGFMGGMLGGTSANANSNGEITNGQLWI